MTRIKVNSRRCQPPGVESQQETADSAGLSKQRQAATETQTDFFPPSLFIAVVFESSLLPVSEAVSVNNV